MNKAEERYQEIIEILKENPIVRWRILQSVFPFLWKPSERT